MSQLKVPIITTIMGEGGSGGALAIAVADKVMMLQYSTYSVISPEGCASILWKDAGKSAEAAEAMGITADKLSKLELIDRIIEEPLGGAHRDYDAIADSIREALKSNLRELKALSTDQLLEKRYAKLMEFGRFDS